MSNLIELQVQEPDREMLLAAQSALTDSLHFVVRTPKEAAEANNRVVDVKRRLKQLEGLQKKLLSPIKDAENTVREVFSGPIAYLKSAEQSYKQGLLDYQDEERRIAQEAARREAERLRKLADAKAKRAEKRGDEEAAAELREQPIIVPTAAPTQFEGTSTRVLWRAELVDIRALCAAIAAGKAPTDLVQFSQDAGNRLATALKDSADVPGLRFVRTKSMAVRS